MPVDYDCIIAGAGFSGATAARCLAEAGRRVLLLERRRHLGGNAYDCYDEAGVLVHPYGPHIFHTQDDAVFTFLSRFTDWRAYRHTVVAEADGQRLPVPFNLAAIEMVFGGRAAQLKEKLASAFGTGGRVPLSVLQGSAEQDLRELADYVLKTIFLHYSQKQWGPHFAELDPAVMARVPVVLSYEDGYFSDKHQGMPADGYTALFERMLNHENITVQLSTDILDRLVLAEDGKILWDGAVFPGAVVYTGALEELFGGCYGPLPYRSLRFEHETLETDRFQSHGVVNYTLSEAFTRITEFKHLTGQSVPGRTSILREYPQDYTDAQSTPPYYPIASERCRALYRQYRDLALRCPRLFLAGRLAEYRYYNMDAAVARALRLAEEILAL